MNYQVTGKDRKRLVGVISETISEQVRYAGTPTYAYHIGDFTVTRYGVLEFDSASADEEKIRERYFKKKDSVEEFYGNYYTDFDARLKWRAFEKNI